MGTSVEAEGSGDDDSATVGEGSFSCSGGIVTVCVSLPSKRDSLVAGGSGLFASDLGNGTDEGVPGRKMED